MSIPDFGYLLRFITLLNMLVRKLATSFNSLDSYFSKRPFLSCIDKEACEVNEPLTDFGPYTEVIKDVW